MDDITSLPTPLSSPGSLTLSSTAGSTVSSARVAGRLKRWGARLRLWRSDEVRVKDVHTQMLKAFIAYERYQKHAADALKKLHLWSQSLQDRQLSDLVQRVRDEMVPLYGDCDLRNANAVFQNVLNDFQQLKDAEDNRDDTFQEWAHGEKHLYKAMYQGEQGVHLDQRERSLAMLRVHAEAAETTFNAVSNKVIYMSLNRLLQFMRQSGEQVTLKASAAARNLEAFTVRHSPGFDQSSPQPPREPENPAQEEQSTDGIEDDAFRMPWTPST